MSNKTPVWSSNEASVFVFQEDPLGVPIGMANGHYMVPTDTPVLEYMFGDGISVSESRVFTRRKETAKPTYTLVDDGMNYSCTIGGLHCRYQELYRAGFFVPLFRFTVVFYLTTLLVREYHVQQHILKHSLFATASITTSDNNPVAQNVKLEAEDFEQYFLG